MEFREENTMTSANMAKFLNTNILQPFTLRQNYVENVSENQE